MKQIQAATGLHLLCLAPLILIKMWKCSNEDVMYVFKTFVSSLQWFTVNIWWQIFCPETTLWDVKYVLQEWTKFPVAFWFCCLFSSLMQLYTMVYSHTIFPTMSSSILENSRTCKRKKWLKLVLLAKLASPSPLSSRCNALVSSNGFGNFYCKFGPGSELGTSSLKATFPNF